MANKAKLNGSECSSNADKGFYKNVSAFFDGSRAVPLPPRTNHMAPSFQKQ